LPTLLTESPEGRVRVCGFRNKVYPQDTSQMG